jgi:hypothetical protein
MIRVVTASAYGDYTEKPPGYMNMTLRIKRQVAMQNQPEMMFV